MLGVDPTWVQRIAAWAAANPKIEELFLYGSRVKGNHQPGSDLDVAIRIASPGESDLTAWMFEGRGWAEELDRLIEAPVHLEMISDDDRYVWPAVREHGVSIYRKGA